MLATTLINCHSKRMGQSVLLWNTRDLNRLAVWRMNTSEEPTWSTAYDTEWHTQNVQNALLFWLKSSGYVLPSSHKATLFTTKLVLITFDNEKIFGLVWHRPDGIYNSLKEGWRCKLHHLQWQDTIPWLSTEDFSHFTHYNCKVSWNNSDTIGDLNNSMIKKRMESNNQ
jgi:hypothetical protein